MKTAFYGRIVFGASAVLFGVIALLWHDPETWQTLRQIWSLPFGIVIGAGLMVLLIAGGIGIVPAHRALGFRRTLRCLWMFFAGLHPCHH